MSHECACSLGSGHDLFQFSLNSAMRDGCIYAVERRGLSEVVAHSTALVGPYSTQARIVIVGLSQDIVNDKQPRLANNYYYIGLLVRRYYLYTI